MKRIATVRSGQANLNLLLTSLVVVVLLLVVCRISLAFLPPPSVKVRNNLEPPGTMQQRGPRLVMVPTLINSKGRNRIPSRGDFSIKVDLIDAFYGAITAFSSHGEFLYSETVCKPPLNQIHLRHAQKNIQTFPLAEGAKLVFAPGGTLLERGELLSHAEPRVPKEAVNSLYDDGSRLSIKTSLNGIKGYALECDHREAPKEIYYSSKTLFEILERSEKDVFWLNEGNISDVPALIKIDAKKIQKVAFPAGFNKVVSLCQTGSMVVGSFGEIHEKEPYRAHILEGGEWRELPMPGEFECSFVQAVTTDGLIFGLVSDARSDMVKQIVWKDKAFKMLGAPPTWPAEKDLPLIDRVSREGYVSYIDRSSESGWKTYLYSFRAN